MGVMCASFNAVDGVKADTISLLVRKKSMLVAIDDFALMFAV